MTPVPTCDSDLEQRIESLLETDTRVLAAYLFGSRARGEERPDSDVDLGILFAGEPDPTLQGEAAELEARLVRDLGLEVQVVALNDAPPDLVHRVLRDGRILCDRDPSARIRFEVDARNRYFDLKPVLDRYRRAG